MSPALLSTLFGGDSMSTLVVILIIAVIALVLIALWTATRGMR